MKKAFYTAILLALLLARLSLPKSLRRVGNDAFFGCGALKDVSYAGTAEAFAGIEIGERGNGVLQTVKTAS